MGRTLEAALAVMAWLSPAIHDLAAIRSTIEDGVDARTKSGHDVEGLS